jgi:hypothetical protein
MLYVHTVEILQAYNKLKERKRVWNIRREKKLTIVKREEMWLLVEVGSSGLVGLVGCGV